jgi:hypothetical protein
MRLTLLLVVPVSLLLSSPLQASGQSSDPDRRSIRVAAGVVSQAGFFGDDGPLRSPRTIGATVSIGVRRHPMRTLGLAFETVVEPASIKNPNFDEGVSRVMLMLGPEVGRRVYVRPMAGGAVNFWSGSRSTGGLALAPAFAAAVGYRHTTRRGTRIQPECVARIAAEFGAVTWSIGAQIAVSLPSW